MKYILEEIIDIMQNDYAGWQDKQGWGQPEKYLQQVDQLEEEGKLDAAAFSKVVENYLRDFKDKHIFFKNLSSSTSPATEVGFRVRRFEDSLYVTHVTQSKRFQVGDRIDSLDGLSIPELTEKHAHIFNEPHPEREDWNLVTKLYDTADVRQSDGSVQKTTIETYPKQPHASIYQVTMEGTTAILTMTDFLNPDAIVAMVEEHRADLESAENWIVDVRINYGGSDSSYFPLLSYIMSEEGVDLATGDEKMLINCTEASAQRELANLREQLAQTEDEGARHFLHVFEREWSKNVGKGFVEFDFSDIMPDLFIKGSALPKQIIVLSDYTCGSSGESFVENCKKSSKITVLGRATMGLNDYANLAEVAWPEGFEFGYPTSRLSRIDANNGMTGIGILPDVYIPWTPENLQRDVEMEKAHELLVGQVVGES